MRELTETDKAAIERHLLHVINRLDKGKGVSYQELIEALVDNPWTTLLDKGKIYEPTMGTAKVVTLLTRM